MWIFKWRRKEIVLFDDLIAAEKVRVPEWVVTLGTDSKCSLGLGAKESMDKTYEGSPEEIIW